jgi:ABC-2 type transport system ATP-binding protein
VIGQLSKGYRQRVGLADALLHRPEVLILDEPTDGLDPNQRREVLRLVGELGRDRTVILSTHILPEVETVCGRVVILDRGRIIAEGAPSELARSGHDLIIVARGARGDVAAALSALDGVTRVDVAALAEAEDTARFTVFAARDVREAAAEAVARAGGKLRELGPRARGLDEVFARLTMDRAPAEPAS